MKNILMGLVGSHAYGLNHADSDEDYRGVYVLPTNEILGVYPTKDTIEFKDPDLVKYELSKYVALALKANPNILELLWLSDYQEITYEGTLLVDIRDAFLSDLIRTTYCGYAMAQMKRLRIREAKGDASFSSTLRKRYSKHARHCFRLLTQGRELLTTGVLTVKVSDPEYLFWLGEQEPVILEEKFEEEFEKLKNVKGILPEKPDYEKVNKVLLEIRATNP